MHIQGIRPEVAGVSPYAAGKTIEEVKRLYGLEKVVKLGSNENPYGPFPAAKKAMREEIEKLHTYPDNSFIEMKRAIAELHGLKEEHVAIAHGAGGMLETLAKLFIEPGSRVHLSRCSYGLYRELSLLMGAKLDYIPMDNQLAYDLKALKASFRPDSRLIWLCNPNNPSGSVVEKQALKELVEALPRGCWLVLDEAYGEFAEEHILPDIRRLIERELPVVSVRTFSKAYALAGARLGYALASPATVQLIDTVAEPFNANRIALAGAKATINKDIDLVRKNIQRIRCDRDALILSLQKRGYEPLPSQSNFVLFHCGTPAGELAEKLLRRGCIVRPAGGWGLEEHIRVTVGSPEENSFFLSALDSINSEEKE